MLSLLLIIWGCKELGGQAFHRGRNDMEVMPSWRWKWLGWMISMFLVGVVTVILKVPSASGGSIAEGGLQMTLVCTVFFIVACLITWCVGRVQRKAYAQSNDPKPHDTITF